jgi:cob(I)alamin adenosyltransferase
MSITTKKGDKGKTSLYRGGRVSKDSLRIEVNGVLDEACSFLGLCRSLVKDSEIKKLMEAIQKDLFVIGSEVSTTVKFLSRLKIRIGKKNIKSLEKTMEKLEKKNIFKESCFYLPGENSLSSSFDIARTIVRRAERRVVSLQRKRMLKNLCILIYLNRLSDLLYFLARSYEKRHHKVKFGCV